MYKRKQKKGVDESDSEKLEQKGWVKLDSWVRGIVPILELMLSFLSPIC